MPQDIHDLETELDTLANRYRGAGGVGIQLLNLLGGQAEGLLDRLPPMVRGQLQSGTESALKIAMKAAHGSRGVLGD